MFPEAFAEKWIKRLTKPGDIVLDPFSGRGTTALTAILFGRRAVTCDVNDVAYCVTKAKTKAPTLATLLRRINRLEDQFDPNKWLKEAQSAPDFFRHAYHPSTLAQLLFLRSLDWKRSDADTMIAALILGALHGEAKTACSYLSNQMPRTISTKPDYSVRFWKERKLVAPIRDAFELLRNRAAYRYQSPVPNGEATVLHADMRQLSLLKKKEIGKVSCAITSPPYLDVTSFEEDQWLRLWFLGGPPHPTRGRVSTDDRHTNQNDYWRFISDMWRCLGNVLAPKSHVIVRIGTRRLAPKILEKNLFVCSRILSRRVQLVSSRISAL
jgi:hypothetical protein